MIFMKQEMLAPALFALAVLARALITVVGVHWASVGTVYLLGMDPDDYLAITRSVFAIILLMVFGVMAYSTKRFRRR
jgi:hypothetical protein